MADTIIEALHDYFGECPLVTDNRLNIEYLANGAAPTEEIVYSYMRHGERCRYPFVLSSVNNVEPDEMQGMCDSGLGERVAAWLRQQTRLRNLPDLPDGLTSRGVRVSSVLCQPEEKVSQYQIQCELEYYRKGD